MCGSTFHGFWTHNVHHNMVHHVVVVSFSSCIVLVCLENRTIHQFLLPALEFSFLLPPVHVLPRCTALLYASEMISTQLYHV